MNTLFRIFITTVMTFTLTSMPIYQRFGFVHAADAPASGPGISTVNSTDFNGGMCGKAGGGGSGDGQLKDGDGNVIDTKSATSGTGQTAKGQIYNCDPSDQGVYEYATYIAVLMILTNAMFACKTGVAGGGFNLSGVTDIVDLQLIMTAPSLMLASTSTLVYLMLDFINKIKFQINAAEVQDYSKVKFSYKYFAKGSKLILEDPEDDPSKNKDIVPETDQLRAYMQMLAGEKIKRATMINRLTNMRVYQMALSASAGLALVEIIMKYVNVNTQNVAACGSTGPAVAGCLPGMYPVTYANYVKGKNFGADLTCFDGKTWFDPTALTQSIPKILGALGKVGAKSSSTKPQLNKEEKEKKKISFIQKLKSTQNNAQVFALMNEIKKIENGDVRSMTLDEYKSLESATELSTDITGGHSWAKAILSSMENLDVVNKVLPSAMAQDSIIPKVEGLDMKKIIQGMIMYVVDAMSIKPTNTAGAEIDFAVVDVVMAILQGFPAMSAIFSTAELRLVSLLTLNGLLSGSSGSILGTTEQSGPDCGKMDFIDSTMNFKAISDDKKFMKKDGSSWVYHNMQTCDSDNYKAPMQKRIRVAYKNEQVIEKYLEVLWKMRTDPTFAVTKDTDTAIDKLVFNKRSVMDEIDMPAAYIPDTPVPSVLKPIDPTKSLQGSSFPGGVGKFVNSAFKGSSDASKYTMSTSSAQMTGYANSMSNALANAKRVVGELGKNPKNAEMMDKIISSASDKANQMAGNVKSAFDSSPAGSGDAKYAGYGFGGAGTSGSSSTGSDKKAEDGSTKATSVTKAGLKGAGAGAAGSGKSSSGFDFSKMNDEEEAGAGGESKASQKSITQALDEYDVGDTDVNKNDKVSIWQILSNRYLKSYPKMLDEEGAPVQPPLKKEEVPAAAQ